MSRWQLWRWPRSKFHGKLLSFYVSWTCFPEEKVKVTHALWKLMFCASAMRMSKTRLLQTDVVNKNNSFENLINSAARFRLTKWVDQSINLRTLLWGESFEFFDRFSRSVPKALRHLQLGTPSNHCPTVSNCSIPPKNSKKCQQS